MAIKNLYLWEFFALIYNHKGTENTKKKLCELCVSAVKKNITAKARRTLKNKLCELYVYAVKKI